MTGCRTPEPDGPDYTADLRWQSGNMEDRNLAWLQHQIPTADFTQWSNEDIEAFRQLVAKHCCSVCGRWDDSGCIEGC